MFLYVLQMAKPGPAGGFNLNTREKLSVNSDLVPENSSTMKLRIQVNFDLTFAKFPPSCRSQTFLTFVLRH